MRIRAVGVFAGLLWLTALLIVPAPAAAQSGGAAADENAPVMVDLSGRKFALGRHMPFKELSSEQRKAAGKAGYAKNDLVWIKWTVGGANQDVVPKADAAEGPDFEILAIRIHATKEGKWLGAFALAVSRKPVADDVRAEARKVGYADADPVYVEYTAETPIDRAAFREAARLVPASAAPQSTDRPDVAAR